MRHYVVIDLKIDLIYLEDALGGVVVLVGRDDCGKCNNISTLILISWFQVNMLEIGQ
jgi:hypothetical protein